MSFDAETVLFKLRDYIKNNIGAAIDAVNAEKNDGIDLQKPLAGDYFVQTFNSKLNNCQVPVYVGLSGNPVNDSNGPSTLETLSFEVVILVTDTTSNDDQDGTIRRVLRYQKVLRDLIYDGWNDVQVQLKFKVENLEPVSFQFLSSPKPYLAIGIGLASSTVMA